jgi:hypothetical protein
VNLARFFPANILVPENAAQIKKYPSLAMRCAW